MDLDRKLELTVRFSHGYTFRKEGYTKIIEYDLTMKQKQQHEALGLKRPNVMFDSQKLKGPGQVSHANGHSEAASDAESSEDEAEAGEDVFSEDQEEEEERPLNSSSLPKSASGKVKTARGRNERVMPPEECRAHLRRLFRNESVMCSLLFGRHGSFAPLTPQHNLSLASADMFFLEVLPVSPTRFRPPAKMGEMLFEHPQNELLAKVLTTAYRLRDLNNSLRAASAKGSDVDDVARRRILQSLLDTLIQLQVDVNSYIDSSKNPTPIRQGRLPPAGVKQGLEKKEGLFRKHMMVSIYMSSC